MNCLAKKPSPIFREVLECASPLALWFGAAKVQSGRGLPQSKTLARRSNSFRVCVFLCFLASPLAGFGQSSILITNLAEQRVEGKKFVQELLSQRPETSSSAKGIIKIRDAKGMTTNMPVRFEIVITKTNWLSIYEATMESNAWRILMKLMVTHEGATTSPYHIITNIDIGCLVSPMGQSRLLLGNDTMISFANSDFWLADLGLEFLHWPEQRLIRKEMRKSVFCKVIESINPQPASNSYSRVVSWIKHDAPAIVHADAYDAKNNLLKVFDPKAVEKVGGEYQLREMEMRNVQTKSVTRIEFEPQAK